LGARGPEPLGGEMRASGFLRPRESTSGNFTHIHAFVRHKLLNQRLPYTPAGGKRNKPG